MKKTKRPATKRKLKGKGILDWAKNAYRVVRNPTQALSQMPKQVSDTLKKYGDSTVREVIVGRTKVLKVVQTLLNAMTLGNFNREKQKYGYDDIFHLYAVLVLDNGVKLITERNQRIVLTEDTNNRDNVSEKISISTNIKLNQLFQNAIKADGDKIWRYDSLSNNCQNFITSLLRNSGYLTEEANTFINQKVDNLLDPTTQNIAQKTTDMASILENLIKGGAIKKKYLKGGGLGDMTIDLLKLVVKEETQRQAKAQRQAIIDSKANAKPLIQSPTTDNTIKGGRKKKLKVKEIKEELKRLKIRGITGKTKPELLHMLKNANH